MYTHSILEWDLDWESRVEGFGKEEMQEIERKKKTSYNMEHTAVANAKNLDAMGIPYDDHRLDALVNELACVSNVRELTAHTLQSI
jgi:hypothetical protein